MKRLALLLAAALLGGCATSTKVQVYSRASTNAGEPVYMMVRTGEQLDLEEPYVQAARRMFTKDKDVQRVERQVILPGKKLTVTLDTPEEQDIGIYFFFTNYKEKRNQFRLVVNRTKLPAEIYIELGDNGILDKTYRSR